MIGHGMYPMLKWPCQVEKAATSDVQVAASYTRSSSDG